MFHRIINPLKSNSFFLFGPRGSGKTTFLKQFFHKKSCHWIDLLNPFEEDRYSKSPQELLFFLEKKGRQFDWIIIDEVQKNPSLLDIVHLCIEKYGYRFALTGSNARKLKRGSANLLAGRAFIYHLFPLTHLEMGDHFVLEEILLWGSLPKLHEFKNDEEKKEYLKAYALTYLKEEIWAEHIVRKLNPFRKFLEVAAQGNGEVINFTNIARDVGADVKTVQSYYQILEDTLLGFMLPAYHQSLRKQQGQSPKFYFFDPGVQKALEGSLNQTMVPNTYAYGKAFEHWLILEILKLNDYLRKDWRFSFLRTKEGKEIDLIIERPGNFSCLVEIKSGTHVNERDTKWIESFLSEFPPGTQAYCLSNDPIPKKIGSVIVLPWQEGLREVGLLPDKKPG